MLYGFLLFSVIVIGVFGFFCVCVMEKSEEKVRTVSVEYEIIEDNG